MKKMELLIWGRGIKFSLLKDRFIDMSSVIGFVDNDKSLDAYLDRPIYAPEQINSLEYDALIVASNSTEAIYRQCIEEGIELSKTIFLYRNWQLQPLNDTYDLMEKVFGKEFTCFHKRKYHVVNAPTVDETDYDLTSEYITDRLFIDDYVRIRSMLMAAKEITENNIIGDIAELGVFRGDFAVNLNRAFSKRRLWLFDTFDGFDKKEANSEKHQGTINETYIKAFERTQEEIVKKRMPYPKRVIIRKGFFPDSLEGLEERFAFVSIDVDLEESTLSGLEYFYPRLSEGGYIFLHDYNYGYFQKVKKAVLEYEMRIGTRLAKVPICDYDGTLVITK